MATIRNNLGAGIVVNNPGTTGTVLELQAGQGASLPIGGYWLTLTPPGELPTALNSEIVGIYIISGGDTISITRAQKGTTAKNIEAGWTAVNGIYDDDVISASQIGMQMFRVEKTATQATGATSALQTVVWQDKVEFKNTNNFNLSDNSWTAPCDGWFEGDITLNVEGGDGGDDSMSWGITKNGSWIARVVDNWRFSSRPGVEAPITTTSAFPVLKGDRLQAQFNDTQSMSINILNTSRWVGKFYPYE